MVISVNKPAWNLTFTKLIKRDIETDVLELIHYEIGNIS